MLFWGLVRMGGLEPPLREELDPKSSAATNYATSAGLLIIWISKVYALFCPSKANAKIAIFAKLAKLFLSVTLMVKSNKA